MASLESIAKIFDFGEKKPLQPPRFAKVSAVTDESVSVTIGAEQAEAVRCTPCQVGDIVLLETLPNGTLAAVATRGATGGGGGSVSWGGISGDMSAQTDLSAALSGLQGGIDAVGCEVLSNATAHETTQPGYSWTAWKYADGRLVVQFSDYWSAANGASFGYYSWYVDHIGVHLPSAEDANAPAFVSTPYIIGQVRSNGASLLSLSVHDISATSIGFFVFNVQQSIPRHCADFVCFGRWK